MPASLDAYRLPTLAVPRHYTIELEPDLAAFTFSGTVAIEVDISAPTVTVVLNAIELDLHYAEVLVGPTALVASSITLDDELERATLLFDAEIPAGPATITIAFTGTLNDKLHGFYRSTFVDDAGETHVIATTQFESTNARRAFPCWDEPDLKATFEVNMVVPDNLMAVSSGPEVARTSYDDGRDRVSFGRTMVMSTYLLAFVVGPLEATDPVDVDGVALRIVYPRGKGHLTQFALDAGAFSLRHFTKYFGIPYPDAKLDLVAVPDFAFGAMENQGCATFREILLLIDPETSSQAEQERAVDVIAHEIAHMWFGNLVTMKWWNGIWLKEAFATFCETHACAAYRPEWERWTSFGLARSAAFTVDSLEATRPVEFEVVSPDEAEAMYDVLTYEKGGSVVRMLEQFLGEDAFAGGITNYLTTHSFANAETHDLWDAIESSTGQPARRVMDTWIFQGGYPIVTVVRTGPTSVRIDQERFAFGDMASNAVWEIPLVIKIGTTSGIERRPLLLSERTAEVDLDVEFDWVLANADGSGFYRVRYGNELSDAVVRQRASLEPIERYGLVDDTWAAFVASRIELRDALAIVETIASDEDNLAVWQRIAGIIGSIDHHLGADARAAFSPRAISWASNALARLGDDASVDDQRQAQLRATLLRTMGQLGDADTVAMAREARTTASDPELVSAAIAIVATNGTADDFAAYVQAYRDATTPQDERRYLFALASFPQRAQLDQLLAMVDAGEVRTQDAPYVLSRSLGNSETGHHTWDYVERNWDTLNERFPGNSITRMIEGITGLGDAAIADRIVAFFAEHQVPQAGKTLDQHLERLGVSVDVRSRIRNALS